MFGVLDCSVDSVWLIGLFVWFVVGPGFFREGPGSPRNPEGVGGLPGPPEPGSNNLKTNTFCWARLGGPALVFVGLRTVSAGWRPDGVGKSVRTVGPTNLTHYPQLRIDIIMKAYFSGTQKSSILWVWTAPGAPETTPKGGALRAPPFKVASEVEPGRQGLGPEFVVGGSRNRFPAYAISETRCL